MNQEGVTFVAAILDISEQDHFGLTLTHDYGGKPTVLSKGDYHSSSCAKFTFLFRPANAAERAIFMNLTP
jgi:hypothetical protein